MDRVFSLFPRLSERKSQLARTLSGGEQQMLALGRGLMALPRLLMVDEPFLGLAPQVMEQMKAVFEALKAEGMAILFIEQNVRLALSMAGRGYILESGRLAIEGTSGLADRQSRGAANFSWWIGDGCDLGFKLHGGEWQRSSELAHRVGSADRDVGGGRHRTCRLREGADRLCPIGQTEHVRFWKGVHTEE